VSGPSYACLDVGVEAGPLRVGVWSASVAGAPVVVEAPEEVLGRSGRMGS
jgi:hypothetical protein